MKRAILCTLIAAALLLSACTRASESTVRAPDAGAPLTLCLGAGPAALDPARTENGVGATYVVNLFAGLTGYRAGGDGKAELTPELCAALPEPESLPDGRVQYVFTLRDGLTWSDGTPLTAADFVYAWNRASTLSDAAAPYLFACIDGYGTGRLNVTASADGRTLTVVLAEAMPTFLQLCAQPAYAPVPSGAADTTSWTADGAAFVTSGPYTVAAWTTESLTYTKNPAYWDADNVAAETVRFVFQSDASAAASAFLAHEYALSWPVPDDALDDLRANHAPELRTVSQLGTYSLCFSMSDPALSAFSQTERAQIRTALALLIDRSYLCSEITPGAQQSANAPIPPGVSDADGSAFTAHNGADGKGGGYYGSDHEANCQQAIALLRQAAESSGRFTVSAQGVCAGFPELTYLTSDAAGHVAIADYLTELYGRALFAHAPGRDAAHADGRCLPALLVHGHLPVQHARAGPAVRPARRAVPDGRAGGKVNDKKTAPPPFPAVGLLQYEISQEHEKQHHDQVRERERHRREREHGGQPPVVCALHDRALIHRLARSGERAVQVAAVELQKLLAVAAADAVGCLLRRAGLQGVVCAHPMFLLMHLKRCRIFHNAIIRIRALRVNRVSFPVRRSRARASCRATAPA